MVRLYKPEKDYDYIYRTLKSEGLKREEMTFELDNTFVFDNGFFSYTMDRRHPRIVHFYVDKNKRSLQTARKMLKFFRQLVIETGHLVYIFKVPANKSYMEVLVRYLKGIRFCETDKGSYYYIPVFGRIKKI